jgi:hypothetical protein
MRRHLIVVGAALALGASACASQGNSRGSVELGGPGGSPTSEPAPATPVPRRVDPRTDGFEIGFGEYAVTLEAPTIRPGRVMFEIRNGGKLVHGFEMEGQDQDGDSSGPGSGGDDAFKIERPSFKPGQRSGSRSISRPASTRSSAGWPTTTISGWRSSSTCVPTRRR